MTESLELTQPRITDKTDVWALVSLLTALIAVSFAAIFMRLTEKDIGANATILNRFVIFALVFGVGRYLRRSSDGAASLMRGQPLTPTQWVLLVVVGLISSTSLVLWALSLTHTTIAKSVLLNNLTPVFTSLGSWLFLGKHFDGRFLVGMGIALSGAIALGVEDLLMVTDVLGEHFLGDIYALISAVFLGAYFLLVEQLRGRFSATTILLCRCSIGSLVLLPVVLMTEGKLFASSWPGWLAVLGLGLICEGMGQRLLADSLNRLSSGFVSLFLLLEPIISALLAWFIFAEGLSLTNCLAFAVILMGIYLAKSSNCSTVNGTERS